MTMTLLVILLVMTLLDLLMKMMMMTEEADPDDPDLRGPLTLKRLTRRLLDDLAMTTMTMTMALEPPVTMTIMMLMISFEKHHGLSEAHACRKLLMLSQRFESLSCLQSIHDEQND